MGVVDDAINKEEQVRAILEESSARLRAKIEARRVSKSAEASVDSVAPAEPESKTIPPEPEIELVIPEVVEGSPKAKKTRKKAPKKSEAGMEPIDIEAIELEKEPLIPDLENAPTITREELEKDSQLAELSQKLDEARKFYVEQDREMDKGASIWKKIFGLGKRLESGTLKQTFDEADARYQNALRDYKDAILATEVKDDEDIEIVTRWITVQERAILDGERADQSDKDKGFGQKAMEYYVSGINKYRKLPWKQRVAIGVGISAIGFGAGMVGGMVGGAAFGAAGLSRIISFSASTVGSKEALEGWDKKRREKRGEEEAKEIIKGSHIERSMAGRWEPDLWNQNLNDKIAKLNEEIQKNKFHGKLRTWGAIGSGVALSCISRYIGRETMEHLHLKELAENIGEKLGFSSGVVVEKASETLKADESFEVGNQKSVMGVAYQPENPVETVKGDAVISDEGLKVLREQAVEGDPATGVDNNITEAADGTAIKGVELTVGETKANSFEGIIREHLDKNPDLIEKYNKMDPKGRTFDAGQIATRMVDDFAKAHNLERGPFSLVHDGFKAQFDPEHMKIIGVGGDDKMGWLADENGPTEIFEKAESVLTPAVETGDFLDEKAGELLENANTDLIQWQAVPERSANVEQYATLGANFTKSLAKLIGGNHFEDWAAVRGLPVKEVASGDSESGKRISALLSRLAKVKLPEANEETMEQFKKMIKPKGEERVYDWMKRVALLVKHSGIKKI